MQEKIRSDIQKYLIPRVKKILPRRNKKLFTSEIKYHINPTGIFVIGGPHGDTGLTGRKIIVDTYGGKGAHGGGAFSGKDPSKVDRSAAYATRHIAKNLVASGVADQILVQVAYAIGVPEPVGLYVNTYSTCKAKDPETGKKMNDGKIAEIIAEMPEFDLRPGFLTKRLGLKNPIYKETAAYGHMGRTPKIVVKSFPVNGGTVEREVELFTWEKLDAVDAVKERFNL
jgi:S-adenosylmethionine synthetase